jgi:predicted ATPase
MINKITIKNFRSLKNISLDLQDVNVLIGANNSGKTNFFKALQFFSDFLNNKITTDTQKLRDFSFNQEEIVISPNKKYNPITIQITTKEDLSEYFYCLEKYDRQAYSQFLGFIENNKQSKDNNKPFIINDLNVILDNFSKFKLQTFGNQYLGINSIDEPNIQRIYNNFKQGFNIYSDNLKISEQSHHGQYANFLKNSDSFDGNEQELLKIFNDLVIYQPNSSKLNKPAPLSSDIAVKSDASNIIAFLDNMNGSYRKNFKQIEQDLRQCIEEFSEINLQTIDYDINELPEYEKDKGKTFKKLGLTDKFGNIYWAENLSEGTLYFLALLGIIHQPNPPKLLLLEEPERGIHPRRINEVMDFIFRLAREKEIQIILTTHSPIILDCFQDFPEKVFVFDKNEEGATEIKNLEKDVLSSRRKKEQKNGIKPIDYQQNMGAYWEAGFFGGVPKNVN